MLQTTKFLYPVGSSTWAWIGCFLLTFLITLCGSLSVRAQEREAASLREALTGGKPLLNLRPRYEHVEQTGKPENADAFTLRTLLGWQTKPYYGLAAVIEGINVGNFNDEFNNTKNGQTQYPTVADPNLTDWNQVYVDYTGIPQTRVRLGKQSIKLDNVRYVGNVEFRQVMQVFNGLTVQNRSVKNLELYGGYLVRLRDVFGDQRQTRTEMLRGAYTWKPGNDLIAFGYFQDQARTGSSTGFADNSNRIVGMRAHGGYPVSDKWKLLYTAEYAKQDNFKNGDPRIDANYWHLAGGIGVGSLSVRLEHERLGSNGGQYGFQTPLGTNHLFQGWADLFLTTPPQGIRDTYATVSATVMKVKIAAEYHLFKSDFGAIRYGDEFDVGLTYAVPRVKGLSLRTEYADFREKDVLAGAARKPDTRKIWFTLLYNFE